MRRSIYGLLGLALTACAAGETVSVASDEIALAWSFEQAAASLRATSCPEGGSFEKPSAITLLAEEIDRGVPGKDSFSGLTFSGAWHLSSSEPGFGGLSGLAVLRSGTLLSLSDRGSWVWIGLDPETSAPDGIGSIATLRPSNGETYPSNKARDAEGLAFREGLAVVSFEHEHRVSAFDLEGCGAGAREALITRFENGIAGEDLPDNNGAEALAFASDGSLRAGFEIRVSDGSPTGRVLSDGRFDQLDYRGQPLFYALTGMDQRGDLLAHVYRAYDPVRGARVILQISGPEGEIARANLKGGLPVDNFEGVAIGENPEGKTRIWLISDDNFSENQRTLLFAFDLD